MHEVSQIGVTHMDDGHPVQRHQTEMSPPFSENPMRDQKYVARQSILKSGLMPKYPRTFETKGFIELSGARAALEPFVGRE
ncbi:hypothetical protein [Fulvimarina sp. MAC3]|uniref:hypothetical protein n=1 Tax=Fulvimarina sp. MAC3 TaxID=3148887 RepID=UPI0031FC29BE